MISSLPSMRVDLDLHDVAARVGDHQAGGHPDLVVRLELAVVEARRAEVVLELRGLDHDLDLAVVGHAAGDLAGQVGDLPLQVADPGLLGEGLDQPNQRGLLDDQLLVGEAVSLQLLGHQELLRDPSFSSWV